MMAAMGGTRRKTAKKAGKTLRRKSAAPRGRRLRAKAPLKRSRNAWISVGLRWAATVGVWAFIGLIFVLGWYASDLPDTDIAIEATRRPTVTLLAVDGSEILTVGDVYGAPVRLSELPPAMSQAVMATEDRRFRRHIGVDFAGLARAAAANLAAGRIVQGGSTITQQVAKNLFLTPERTIERKIKELMLALWLENRFSKDQILTLYLNRVYLGAGVYGVDAAARKYFGRSARRLTVYQSAMLAGLLKAPSRYNPINNPKLARQRTRQVLVNMVAAGYLSKDQARAIRESGQAKVVQVPGGGQRYFADWVLEQIPAYVRPGGRDILVHTTFDPALQASAERAVTKVLAKAGEKFRIGQGALAALTLNGAVRAMVGGRAYGSSQFNRATQALRQPGSAFKPFVYMTALEAGMEPSSWIVDQPITIDGWTPHNIDKKHRGKITLAQALSKSVNTVAVALSESLGPDRVIKAARRLGVTTPLKPHPSLALGVGEVSLLELTTAYGAFANGGLGLWAHGVEKICDEQGRVLYQRTGGGPGRVMAPAIAAQMNAMLAGAVRNGTGRKAALDRPVAGKTGTSQDFRDAWFIGYSAGLVAGVWLGNDDGRPMRKVTGGGLPARIWRAFMVKAHQKIPPKALPGVPLDGAGG